MLSNNLGFAFTGAAIVYLTKGELVQGAIFMLIALICLAWSNQSDSTKN